MRNRQLLSYWRRIKYRDLSARTGWRICRRNRRGDGMLLRKLSIGGMLTYFKARSALRFLK